MTVMLVPLRTENFRTLVHRYEPYSRRINRLYETSIFTRYNDRWRPENNCRNRGHQRKRLGGFKLLELTYNNERLIAFQQSELLVIILRIQNYFTDFLRQQANEAQSQMSKLKVTFQSVFIVDIYPHIKMGQSNQTRIVIHNPALCGIFYFTSVCIDKNSIETRNFKGTHIGFDYYLWWIEICIIHVFNCYEQIS